ncbi:hypothetical protein BDZ89DRAFT_1045934 [Hymenopellis radicata]|nr:hypothetical protein BDZ89DRAFT_1045934 [Hymenopellis radicata]
MPDHENDNERPTEGVTPSPVPEAVVVSEIPADGPFAPAPGQPGQHFFGLKQNVPERVPPAPIYSDDYEKRFHPDPYGEETAPNARVWRVYVEEAAAFDATMIGESRDGLDVMLVFAGLFSAVVTSFLVQVSQNLQADFSQMSALLLHDLVSVQLAMADNNSFPNITSPSVNPNAEFTPDAIDVWVNGLWMVSLTASLSVALAAVLVKQWLHHYMSLPSGTPGIRSHVRQFRFMGLEQWRVSVIIGMLPIIMHASLALFLSDFVLFYVPLHASLAWTVGVLTVIVASLYVCPYHSPLTLFLCEMLRLIHLSQRRLLRFFEEGIMHHTFPGWMPTSNWIRSLAKVEEVTVHSRYDEFSVHALDWLFHLSSNPTVRSVVIQAIGGLPATAETHALAAWDGQEDIQVCQTRSSRTLETAARVTKTLWNEVCESNVPGLLEFFLLHHAEKFHPLVWRNLVETAHSEVAQNIPRINNLHLNDSYAHLITLLLPSLWPPDPKPTEQLRLQTMTLPDAARAYFRSSIYRDLAIILSPSYDDSPLSEKACCGILVAAGEFALRRVAEDGYLQRVEYARSRKEWRHLELLDLTLHYLANRVLFHSSGDHTIGISIGADLRPMVNEDEYAPLAVSNFFRDVISRTTICDFAPLGDYHGAIGEDLVER